MVEYRIRHPRQGREHVVTDGRPATYPPGELPPPMPEPQIDVTFGPDADSSMESWLRSRGFVPHQRTPSGGHVPLGAVLTTGQKFAKWVKPVVWILAGLAGVAFGVGMTYQQFLGGNATKGDLKQHVQQDLEPVRLEVKAVTEKVGTIETGVTSLVTRAAKEDERKAKRKLLDKHDRQHQQRLEEWSREKAAGRRAGPRPIKKPEHLQLETDLGL